MNIKNPNHTLSLSDGTSITYSDIFPQRSGKVRCRVISKSGGASVTLKTGENKNPDGKGTVKGTWMNILHTPEHHKPLFIRRDIDDIKIEDIAPVL